MVKVIWVNKKGERREMVKAGIAEAKKYASRVQRFADGEILYVHNYDPRKEAEKKAVAEPVEKAAEVKPVEKKVTHIVTYMGRTAVVPVNVSVEDISSACKMLRQGGYKTEVRDKGLRTSRQIKGHKWKNEYILWENFSQEAVSRYIIDNSIDGLGVAL